MTGPRLTGGRCQCSQCGLFFTGTREFDRHRTGSFGEIGQCNGDRRCLSVPELEARGWQMTERGFWMQPRPQRAPAGIQAPSPALTATVGGAP